MKLMLDACSVILLAKASTLETLSETHDVCITSEVFDEVEEGKKKMFPDALLLEKLCKEKKVTVISINASAELIKKLMLDFNMEKGEASTVGTAIKENWVVATDNRQGRKAAEVYGLHLVGSIEIVVSLYKQKKITQDKATSALNVLKKEGWFDANLTERAREDIT